MTNEIREKRNTAPLNRDAWIFQTSFAQRRLRFMEQIQPGNSLRNVPGDHDTSVTRNANLSAVGQEMRRALDAFCVPEPLSQPALHQA